MKSSLNKSILLMLIASTVSLSASIEKPATVSTPQALSTLGSALKTDATALGAKTVEVSQAIGAGAQNCFYATVESLKNMHNSAKNGTVTFGNWVSTNPNIAMAIAATAVLGYSVYKIRQMYQTYKRGAQTATIHVKVSK
ncbi:MAG: hypothetical protein P4L31_06985 [Candidatus Babeliales bacterium]|nr:hypothetical protein [Candidatus Babeliales bacterium]